MTGLELRPGRGGWRRGATPVAVVALIALVLGLMIALGGSPSGTATATASTPSFASSAFNDMRLVPVAPTGTRTATAPLRDVGSAPPSLSATPAVEGGIRANRVRIARLGIDLAIIEGDGIEAPIGKAAHYPGSAWPGAGSNIYIYGHARDGMFITLWQARVGDTIELDLVDGTSRGYVVTKVLPKVPFDAVKYLEPTDRERLTLQTSTSYYPTAPRFVVLAIPRP